MTLSQDYQEGGKSVKVCLGRILKAPVMIT